MAAASPSGGDGAPEPRTLPVGRVRLGGARVSPSEAISPDSVRRAAYGHAGHLRYCYALGLERDPTLAGMLILRLEYAADGAVRAATVERHDEGLSDASVLECIAGVAERWRVPPFELPEGAIVRIPMRLDPPATN